MEDMNAVSDEGRDKNIVDDCGVGTMNEIAGMLVEFCVKNN